MKGYACSFCGLNGLRSEVRSHLREYHGIKSGKTPNGNNQGYKSPITEKMRVIEI